MKIDGQVQNNMLSSKVLKPEVMHENKMADAAIFTML